MTRPVLFILTILLLFSCKKEEREYTYKDIDFKEEMRNFVIGISDYAKNNNDNFVIIPQNAVKLITVNASVSGSVHQEYLDAIDGQAQEGLFYGYTQDDVPTPAQTTTYLRQFLDKAKQQSKSILVTDYCISPNHVIDSYQQCESAGYVDFVATSRELDIIPPVSVFHANSNSVTQLAQAENFLYLLNMHNFPTKQAYIQAVCATNYDILITDLFFEDGTAFTPEEVNALKHKLNGGTRMLIAYVSIGEAEDYRYYWQEQWNNDKPVWLDQENPEWHGNYKVRYWEKDWQNIIYGNNQSYIKKILDAGFDGAYLDIVDAFEYFEERNP